MPIPLNGYKCFITGKFDKSENIPPRTCKWGIFPICGRKSPNDNGKYYHFQTVIPVQCDGQTASELDTYFLMKLLFQIDTLINMINSFAWYTACTA
jgi:hypothetical protein